MSDYEYENQIGEPDTSEFSLEAILAEFRSKPVTEAEQEPELLSRPLNLEEGEDSVGEASISSVDELLFPEHEEEPPSVPEAEPERAPEPDASKEAEPGQEPEAEAAPETDDGSVELDIETGGYDEAMSSDLYAGVELPEMEPEPEPVQRGAPQAGFGEKFLTRIVALLALASMKRQQSRAAPAAESEEKSIPEMPAAKAVSFYTAQQRPLRLRFTAALIVSLVLAYISFGYSAGLPLPGDLAHIRVAALFSLIAELTVILLGLDVFTHGLTALARGCPNGESLVSLSCIASALDAVYTAAAGGGTRGLPFCAVSALSMSFALWGGQLFCRAYRLSFRALAMGKSPHAVTAMPSEDRKDYTLIKSQREFTGFIHRSEEASVCEDTSRACAPFLIVAAPVLAFLATVARGAPGNFFHVYAVLAAVCAPFSALFGFPLLYFLNARRLIQSGAAIAGWAGARDIGRAKCLVIKDSDLFPPGSLSVSGIRVLEGVFTDKVISYTGSMLTAAGSGLAPLFTELMRRNGCSMQRVDDFSVGEGGIRAFVRGEEVCVGSSGFMHLCGVRLPQKHAAKNAVFTAISGTLVGIFTIEYSALPSVKQALSAFLRSRRGPVFAVRDFNVDPLLVRQVFKMSTEGFEFPSFSERYRISAALPSEESPVAAVLARDGLAPFVEVSERGLRMYRTARLFAVITVLCSAVGLLLMFLLSWNFAFESASAGNVITYMFLWLVPVAVMTFGFRE